MLRIWTLGELHAEDDGRPLHVSEGPRIRSLLAWLALHPGVHPRSELAGRLWPDSPEPKARASLRSALWTLRRALGPARDCLAATRETVGFVPGELWVDALRVRELAAAGRTEEALELCRGELLPELDEDWVYAARDEHRGLVAGLLARAAADAERKADLEAAVRLTEREIELDPLREDPWRELIRRLATSGDRAGALAAFARLRETLRRELGIDPSEESRRLLASLRAEPAREAVEFPAPAGPEAERYPLVGRERELEVLRAAWQEAIERGGRVAVISGEAGIGKTRLEAELEDIVKADGAWVCRCAGIEGGGALGLGVDLLRELARLPAVPPATARWPGELARVVPELAERWGRASPPRGEVPPELERARLFEAFCSAIAWAAADRPLLLVLEDIHLADPASVELAGYVARRVAELPALCLLTRRDEPQRPDLDALLYRMRAGGLLSRDLRLTPLGPADVRRLAGSVASLDARQLERVVVAAEGNPLLAVESARAFARGDPAVPESLQQAVRAAFAGLPGEARRLADLVAAAGRELGRDELGALGLAAPGDAVRALADTGLFAAHRGELGYRHALLREAAYASLPDAERAGLHESVAQAVAVSEHSARRAAEIARHLRLAGLDRRAVRHLTEAAAHARALGALDEAASELGEALTLSPEDPDLALELGEIEAWRGRREAAEELFARALERIEPGDLTARAAVWLRRARWYHTTLCVPHLVRASCAEACAALDAGGLEAPELRAEALASSAWAEALGGDPDEADRLLAEVDALGGSVSDHELGETRAFALIRRGRFADAYDPLVRSAQSALWAGRPDLTYGGWMNAACAATCAGDFERALGFVRRGLEALKGQDLAVLDIQLLAARAYIELRLGRTEEARATAEEERRLAERIGEPELEALAAHDLGRAALASGDPASAERLIARALEGHPQISRPLARLTRAEALVRLGRLEEAERELREAALEPVAPSDFPDTLVLRIERIQGLIAAARGMRAEAMRHLDAAARGWHRRLEKGDRERTAEVGEGYATVLADLGRPPVAGLVEPARELELVLADREAIE